MSRADEASPRRELYSEAPLTAEELQAQIDRTSAYGTVTCDRNRQLIVSTTVHVRKPLTIRGLSARLADGLGKTTLLLVEAEGVTVSDFVLWGNADTVEQSERASLLVFHAGNLRVEDGRFDNVAKNGLTIEPQTDEPHDISGGVVRNLIGDGVVRDVVSISGGDGEAVVRDIVVENIRSYRSKLRGAVEVSDGSQNIKRMNGMSKAFATRADVSGRSIVFPGRPRLRFRNAGPSGDNVMNFSTQCWKPSFPLATAHRFSNSLSSVRENV